MRLKRAVGFVGRVHVDQLHHEVRVGPSGADNSFGGDSRLGLSLVGEPVVMAFRLEKFASEATGHILACRMTQELASQAFTFTDLGEMQAKGFDRADHVFALVPECP